MLNPEGIITRSCQLMGEGAKLSEQAKAVIRALCEEINVNSLLVNQALMRQVNAVKNTPTGRMKKPTLDEIKLHGAKIGLSEKECEKFFDFYEANGWRSGKSPMRLWTAAMANWKRRFDEPNNGAATVIMGKEYERILQRMQTIKGNYGDHQEWDEREKAEFQKLKLRRDDLRKRLNITI